MWQRGYRRDTGTDGDGPEKKDGTATLMGAGDRGKFLGRDSGQEVGKGWLLGGVDWCWVILDPSKGVKEILRNSKRGPRTCSWRRKLVLIIPGL